MKKKQIKLIFGLSLLLCAVLVLVSLVGNPELDLIRIFQSSTSDYNIFIHARLPRILLAFLVGWTLALTGTSFQAILRNPLADPYILGVSSGSALGGALALVFDLEFEFVLLAAFISGIISIGLIYSIAKVKKELPVHSLLLTGVIFNSFSFAIILLLHAVVTIGESQQILYLMIGNLDAVLYNRLIMAGLILLIGSIYLFKKSKEMNVMVLGDESATQLGLNPGKFRKKIFIVASIMIACVVTMSGLIGFVGLLVPHLMRFLVGSDHRVLVPVSALSGGVFLMASDWIAKNILVWLELGNILPVGIITALMGGPFFVYLLTRHQARWS